MNLIKTKIAEAGGGLAQVEIPGGGTIGVPLQGARFQKGADVILGVRPEHLSLGNGVEGKIPGKVRLAEQLGAETILYIDVPDAEPIVVRSNGMARERSGDDVRVGLSSMSCHLFSPEGKALVNGSLL
jgi:ABC-type sugar transport system ATPase subunit